ncbi:hypothetical protein [Niabella sp.]|uniref:hypothetical protein n=1 Tax=Niabella sp. TaxID=1962976 RepID=UPI0026394AF2|nr:hypothetical protein [Niabella sp.]
MKIVRCVFCILSFMVLSFMGYGQNCKAVSTRKDKENGIITVSGIATSKDFYSLLIQKQMSYDDTLVAPRYLLFLNAASRVKFSDSTLKTKGTFHLKLLDSSMISLDSVSFINRPLGFSSLGFKVYVNEKVVQALSLNPIVTLMVDDKLKTDFKLKEQKKQQKIAGCLLQRKA